MKAVREKIGNAEILIEMSDEKISVKGENQGGTIVETGIDDQLREAYSKAKLVIKEMAQDMGGHFKDMVKENSKDLKPKNLEMEFNMALSAQTGTWILKGKGECVFKVKMVWEFDKNE